MRYLLRSLLWTLMLGVAASASTGAAAPTSSTTTKKKSTPVTGAAATAKVVVPADVRYVPEVAYLPAERTEKLDLYLPAQPVPGERRPAVLLIHGGGWMGGDKAASREQNIGTRLVQAGFVAASVNYRLGEGAWPTNLHDCKNAVRFLRVHAAEYGLDPDRIGVLGGSAGGHLALMVGLTGDQPEFEPTAPYPGVSSRVGAIVDLYGITNLNTRQSVDKQGHPTGQLVDGGATKVYGATREQNPELWRKVSPVTHVRRDSPPVLVAHGLADATVDYEQAKELARVLQEKGATYELILLEGVGHTFDFDTWNKKPLPLDFRSRAVAFLQRHLGRPTAAAR